VTREYQPYIVDPEYIRQFEGRRFVVLRAASDEMRRVFEDAISAFRHRFPSSPLSYLAKPHVTLAGFAAGTDLNRVRELSDTWAATVPPLSVDVEGIDVISDPFGIVLLKVRKTADLVHALSAMRQLSESRGPRVSDEIPVEAWMFHMSVAYGAGRSAGEWNDVVQFVPE
jgi:hypothetical protein